MSMDEYTKGLLQILEPFRQAFVSLASDYAEEVAFASVGGDAELYVTDIIAAIQSLNDMAIGKDEPMKNSHNPAHAQMKLGRNYLRHKPIQTSDWKA